MWGGGGGKNVIHVASMYKTLVFAAFSLLCTTHCARMWNRTRCHKRPCQLRRCTKHWYLPRFRFFAQHTVQGCGTGHVVTSVHANCDDAQNTGICRVFASLYNTLCKDVEQDTLSQASMPIATMPKTLVFTAFSLLCTTHCARMWNWIRCYKRPCQLRRCPKHWYLPHFRLAVRHTAQECVTRKAVTSVHAFG